jgi:bacterioferritin
MATATHTETTKITRETLIEKLNEDLAREYQAIIAYVVYSQVLKGAEYMNIAKELEVHAGEELRHALTIREILRQEQEHQIDLATALGEDVPNVSQS